MWIGLFSDIHANREALEASLEHARRAGISRFIFLGDYVGYGADPAFAVDTVMREVEAGAVALLGNHDAAISTGTGGMNHIAAEAIDWTRPRLDRTQSEFLTRLPLTFEDGNRLFVHASANAPQRWEYIISIESASRSFLATRAQATFCGHVHVPQLYHLSPTGKLAGFAAGASRGNPATRAAALACGDWFGRAAARLQSGRLLRRARYRTQRADLCACGVRQRNRSAENTRSRSAGIPESTFDRGCLNFEMLQRNLMVNRTRAHRSSVFKLQSVSYRKGTALFAMR